VALSLARLVQDWTRRKTLARSSVQEPGTGFDII
jgi:hypothetical protein